MAHQIHRFPHRPGQGRDGPHLHGHHAHRNETRHGFQSHEKIGDEYRGQVHHRHKTLDGLGAQTKSLCVFANVIHYPLILVHQHVTDAVGSLVLALPVVLNDTAEGSPAAVSVHIDVIPLQVHSVGPFGQWYTGQRRRQGQRHRCQSQPGRIQRPGPDIPIRRERNADKEAADGDEGIEYRKAVAQKLGEVPDKLEKVSPAGAALLRTGFFVHNLLCF